MQQKRKSGIVLLITLFFIFSISILIMKNLDDHTQFIDESEFETTLIQAQISSKNVENEIISLVKKYYDNIDEILDITSKGIPFDYGNIKLNIVLEDYGDSTQCDLNDINDSLPLVGQCEQYIVDNISYPSDFTELLKDYKNKYEDFKNQDQVDYFLDDYKYQTRDENIENVQEDFTFLSVDDNASYFQCDYEMLINSNTINGTFVFDAKGNQTKESFTLSL